MKFDLKKHEGKFAMHCKSREEAWEFCLLLDDADRTWWDDTSYRNTKWHIYEEDTCYDFNGGGCSERSYYESEGYTILEWSDFTASVFRKEDLLPGMLVQNRAGSKFFIVEDIGGDLVMVRDKYWFDLINLDNSMLNASRDCVNFKDYDVMKVWSRPSVRADLLSLSEEKRELLFERKDEAA